MMQTPPLSSAPSAEENGAAEAVATEDAGAAAQGTPRQLSSDESTADEYVLWAYRLLLGREPDTPAHVSKNPFRHDRRLMVRHFVSSPEYARANALDRPRADVSLPEQKQSLTAEGDVDDAVAGRFDEYALLKTYQGLTDDQRAELLRVAREMRGTALPRPWLEGFDNSVRQADVASMLRLILGRGASGPKEWEGSLYWLNHNLNEVVRSYLTSAEFGNRGLLTHFTPEAIELASFENFSVYAALDDKATGAAIITGRYEPHVASTFRKYLRPGMAVIDIGANIGYFSMLAASIVGPQGSVTAIEPNPDNLKLLEASRRHNGFEHLRIAGVAAGRQPGVLLLKSDSSNGTTVKPRGDSELWSSRLVPCLPLQTLIPGDRPVDFIKIDVEGAEYEALIGCADLLKRDRPMIVSEFSPDALPNVSGVDGETYLRFLISCGLSLSVIHQDGEIERFGDDTSRVIAFWRQQIGHIDIIASRES